MSSSTGPDPEQSSSSARDRGLHRGAAESGVVFDPEQILAALERHQVEYVVVGGYAARLHGAERATRDVDVTPRTTAANLDRLAAALNELGARVRTEAVPEGLSFSASRESLTGVRMLNLVTDYGEVDLTVHPAGFEGGWDDLHPGSRTAQLGAVRVQVAALEDVIASKEQAGRDKDLVALPELYALAGTSGDAATRRQGTAARPAAHHPPQRQAPQNLSARERIEQARRQVDEQRRAGPPPPEATLDR